MLFRSYVHFGTADLFVPFASSWKPLAVAWGIIGMYLLIAVQGSSWLMKKLPKKTWRAIHMLSYVAFIMVTWHAITAGTDASSRWYGALTIAMVALACAFGTARLITLKTPATRRPLSQMGNQQEQTKKEESRSVFA